LVTNLGLQEASMWKSIGVAPVALATGVYKRHPLLLGAVTRYPASPRSVVAV